MIQNDESIMALQDIDARFKAKDNGIYEIEITFIYHGRHGKDILLPDLNIFKNLLHKACKEYRVLEWIKVNEPSDEELLLTITKQKDEETRELMKKELKNR